MTPASDADSSSTAASWWNDILSINRITHLSVTIDANAPVNVNAHVHQDMNTSVMNVVDSLNAHAGDTWQESDVASQA